MNNSDKAATSPVIQKQKAEGYLPPSLAEADNENIRDLPNHLRQFVVDQNYDQYTPIDHAVWRYVMRQNYSFLKDHAHEAYVGGLNKTGIGIDKIPSITEMNEILSRIGWAAVTVDGFIPPAAFMEFQAYKVLVIAAAMRQIDHIEYTPAPDIIHEAAGHAPIIADAEYAEYLRRIGEVGARAMSSRKDFELYEAIRHLSILKETPNADPKEIESAEKDVEYKQDNLGQPSEMARLSRLHWWTVEYGLVGNLRKPKIYGAGLLSSIGESANCLTAAVKKIPYNIDTANYAFDITTQQPHLFVTPDFQHLLDVLEEFADSMAFRVGGREGLGKAIECRNPCTAVYSSGLQVSGVFTEASGNGQSMYIKTTGPTALALDNKQLSGHGREYHADGFGSPVGRLKEAPAPLEDLNDEQLKQLKIEAGKDVELQFESGVTVKGHLDKVVRQDHKILLMTFSQCRVTHSDKLLFDPNWGVYDMAVGERIDSVFCGAADKDNYENVSLVPKERTIRVEYDEPTRKLHVLYQKIRNVRDNKTGYDAIPEVWRTLQKSYPREWLLPLEILEILTGEKRDPELQATIRQYLQTKAKSTKELAKLINDGLNLLK